MALKLNYMKQRENGVGYYFNHDILQKLFLSEKLACMNDFIQKNHYDFLKVVFLPDYGYMLYNKNRGLFDAVILIKSSNPTLQFCRPDFDEHEIEQIEVMAEIIFEMHFGFPPQKDFKLVM